MYEYWKKYCGAIAASRHWQCHGCPSCSKLCGKNELMEEHCKTLHAYDNYLQCLNRYMVYAPLSEISIMELRNALQSMQDDRSSLKKYSDSTMRTIFSALCDILQYAQAHGHANNILAFYRSSKKNSERAQMYALIDPLKSKREILDTAKELREKTASKPRSLTLRQMQKLILLLRKRCPADGRALGLLLMLYAGLRPAEVRALCWGDIIAFHDYRNRFYLNIHRHRNRNGDLLERTKTRNGNRKIPIHTELLPILLARMQQVKNDYIGKVALEDLPVCCVENTYDRASKDFELANLAMEFFRQIQFRQEDYDSYLLDKTVEQFTSGREKLSSEGESLYLYVLRKNFWTVLESCSQLTDMEKRYVMGHAMISDKRDLRRTYNDEGILWDICQKMDCCAFSSALHEPIYEAVIPGTEAVQIDNRGLYRIHLTRELIQRGGTLHLHLVSAENKAAIVVKTDSPRSLLKQLYAPFTVAGTSKNSTHIPVGINREAVNREALIASAPRNR